MNTPDETTKRYCDTLLAATAADNLEQFVSVVDDAFRNGLKPEVFHRVNRELAPRMQKGFTSTFLGELYQNGCVATVWRLRFGDGKDDLLFRMAIANGRVVRAVIGPAFG